MGGRPSGSSVLSMVGATVGSEGLERTWEVLDPPSFHGFWRG